MPKPYPREFRDDVVRVARNREAGVSLSQVAADFGIHEMTLRKWLRTDDESAHPAPPAEQSGELRELKRRNRLLEQENEVLRRAAAYLSQDQLPGNGSTRSSASWPPTGSPWWSRAGYWGSLASPITGGVVSQ